MSVSRFLFVVPPLVGHINPAVGLAERLTRQGHEVAWAGHVELVRRLAGPDARVLPCAVPDADGAATERPAELRGPAALKYLWETFLVPLAEAMMPGVEAAVDRFEPDVLVVDQQAVAGAVVAQARGIPWATSATTAAELADPLGAMPKVASWVRELLLGLELRHGDPNAASSERYQGTYGDLRFSPYLVLAYSTAELSGCPAELEETLRYVGPSITQRPSDRAFPWHRLPDADAAQLVLISLGTANADAGGGFLRACAEAMGERPDYFAVLVDPAGAVTNAPANVLVVEYVPQLELLPRTSAVICHAGQNTVCESLYHGVPLLVAPIRDDQPIVAQQAVDAGVAERLRFGRVRPIQIAEALDRLLAENSPYRAAAQRVSESFQAAGGADAAAQHLVRLAEATRGPRELEGPVCIHASRKLGVEQQAAGVAEL